VPQSETTKSSARPFLKWAGGKRQLLETIDQHLPDSIRNSGDIHRYVEPFVGGGAVFFHLQEKYEVEEAYLYDINRELVVGYRAIQEEYTALIEALRDIEEAYLNRSSAQRKKYFYQTRDRYNAQMKNFEYKKFNPQWIVRASMLIFLNKTCYNGLFRQNQQGEFNVPHGRYANPTICDSENITAVHQALQNAKIFCADFKASGQHINDETFVYFDPPYRPLSKTSSFTSYFKSDFTDEDQRRLADFFHKMDKRGASLLLSNSDPKNEDPDDSFFEELYAGDSVKIEKVSAKRYINSDGAGRGDIDELIVCNYQKNCGLKSAEWWV